MSSCKPRRTHEQFIIKVNEYFPTREWEVIGIYEHNKTPILLRDKYGDCLVMPNALFQKSQPSIKTAINPTKYTINKFKEIWGELYDYSKFTYLGARVKSTIICKEHGEFLQDANMHLSGRCGCVECVNEAVSKRVKSNTDDFINKAINRWNYNKRIYDKVEYKGAKENILIYCEICEDYYKTTPNAHLTGNGCPVCALKNKGYSKTDYINLAKGREGMLYLIKCWNETEEFYKIGITLQELKDRYSGNNSLPYFYELMYSYKCDAGCVWDMEKDYHRKYKTFQYIPNINFGGYTECFNTSLPIQEIINNLKIPL